MKCLISSGRISMGILLALCLLVTSAVASDAAGVQSSDPVARISIGPTRIDWQPVVNYERLVLTVSGPDGNVARQEFESGMQPYFEIADLNGKLQPDGQFTYELLVIPTVDKETRKALRTARRAEDRNAEAAAQNQDLPAQPRLVQSGHFSVLGSAFVVPEASEKAALLGTVSPLEAGVTPLQVINGDLTVRNSLCVGTDCADVESFGFDTIRLKENNLRIKFEDTSNSASFPTVDWQITANDSSNGGANKFSIDDIDNARTPFTIMAGAQSNSIFVDSSGRLGLKTSTPVTDIHTRSGNTPTLRLEQDGSSGFTPQTWDVAGNETNLFIRDVTGGSRLPFRIRPGAPTSSIDIAASGNVGVGTAVPAASLHVVRSDGNAKLVVEETSSTVESRFLFELKNNGAPGFQITNTDPANAHSWQFSQNVRGDFIVSKTGTGGSELMVRTNGSVIMGPGGASNFVLSPTGNLTIAGTLSQNSDVNAKERFAHVDGREVLDRLRELKISAYSYKTDPLKSRHVGPMAQDFHAAFGLGGDDRHIAPMDATGVALAAIKELHQAVQQKDAQIAELQERLSILERKLNAADQP